MYFTIIKKFKPVVTRLMLLKDDNVTISLKITEDIPKLNENYVDILLFRAFYQIIDKKQYNVSINSASLWTIADIVNIYVEKLKIWPVNNNGNVNITITGSEGFNVIENVVLLRKNWELTNVESELVPFDTSHYITRDTYDKILNFLLSFQPAKVTANVGKGHEDEIKYTETYRNLRYM